ncbi:MAG: LytTR family DNA-binding domain-containing protein [Bacteroidota bacterium]
MIRCLIVDDEPLSLDVLERYINDIPDLELAGRSLDAFDAMTKLKELEVDLLFLDINMPKLSGINMLKSIEVHPEVIITTAYPEYAVEGFELDVLDYLVKPISFERFVKAVKKAQKKLQEEATIQSIGDQSFIMVKVNKKLYKIPHSEIKYVESMGDFVKIHTRDKVHIVSNTLKNIEEELPGNKFIRTHKSYIISIDRIKYLEGNQIRVDTIFLPIGLTYKESLLQRLDIDKNKKG